MSDVTFKHVLLPVWMAAYKFQDRSFRFVVNGQTGKVQGERPWSKWKIALASSPALILGGIASTFTTSNQGGGLDQLRRRRQIEQGDGPSWLNDQ
jgi:hypothetical protein